MDSLGKTKFVWSLLGRSLVIWGGYNQEGFLFEKVCWKISQT
jgi:hypothetical protein